jgi:hypothetical protein
MGATPVRDHDVVPKIRCSIEPQRATRHAGGGESLARVSDCVPDAHEPVDQLLVTRLILPLLSSDLPDPVAGPISSSVEPRSDWAVPWHLNDNFRGSSRVCRRLNRLFLASDFPGERSAASIDDAPIPGTRSGDGVLVVSSETPELAFRRHHRTGDGRHQSAVRHALALTLVSTTFQFAREALRDAQIQCNQ